MAQVCRKPLTLKMYSRLSEADSRDHEVWNVGRRVMKRGSQVSFVFTMWSLGKFLEQTRPCLIYPRIPLWTPSICEDHEVFTCTLRSGRSHPLPSFEIGTIPLSTGMAAVFTVVYQDRPKSSLAWTLMITAYFLPTEVVFSFTYIMESKNANRYAEQRAFSFCFLVIHRCVQAMVALEATARKVSMMICKNLSHRSIVMV